MLTPHPPWGGEKYSVTLMSENMGATKGTSRFAPDVRAFQQLPSSEQREIQEPGPVGAHSFVSREEEKETEKKNTKKSQLFMEVK